MKGDTNDYLEEQHFRRDAERGSRKLLIALLRLHGIEIARRPKAPRKYPAKPVGPFPPNPIVQRYQRAVAAFCGFDESYLYLPGNKRWYARPRQVAMYLAHEAGVSLPEIGKHFGRDHTTVLFGCRAVRANTELWAIANTVAQQFKEPVDIGDTRPLSANTHPEYAKEHYRNTQEERLAA